MNFTKNLFHFARGYCMQSSIYPAAALKYARALCYVFIWKVSLDSQRNDSNNTSLTPLCVFKKILNTVLIVANFVFLHNVQL